MYKLGIDIGSTTIKMALVEVLSDQVLSGQVPSAKDVRILATDYRRHNAEPMKVGQEMIEGILQRSGLTVSEANGLTATRSNSPQDGLTGIAGPFYLGVDSGSTTTKLVLINEKGELLFTDYSYNNGNSLQAFHSALQRMRDALGLDIEIAGSCSTGYGEQLLKTAFNPYKTSILGRGGCGARWFV